jgi:hypothetical protein
MAPAGGERLKSTTLNPQSVSKNPESVIPEALSSHRFDALFIVVSLWFVGGLFLDGWAHNHGQVDQSFFTPWHAVLYSGQLAVLLFLLAALWQGRAPGRDWRAMLPPGYALSLVGAMLWVPAGMGDLLWHTFFGIEKSFEALLSPTHLALGFAGCLMVSGPLRAGWQRRAANKPPSLARQWPMLLSLAFLLSTLTFFTQEANPIASFAGETRPSTAVTLTTELGVIGMLFTAALIIGAVLPLVAHWHLAPGALTLIFTVNAVLMGFQNGPYPALHVLSMVLAGLVADGLLAWLRPSAQRLPALRLFAFLAPSLTLTLYFAAAQLTTGIWWSVHVWTGVVVMSGMAGLLLSLLFTPRLSADGC